MAEPISCDASPRARADVARRLAGVGLVLIGLVGIGFAATLGFQAWSTDRAWQGSPEAAALARQAAEPAPIWIDAEATPAPVAVDLAPLPAPETTSAPPVVAAPVAEIQALAPEQLAPASAIALDAVDFRFLDPPQPGAHARVALSLANKADAPSARILLGIPAAWFESYSIIGSAPAVSQDRTNDDGVRTFSFPPLAAGSTATYELHVTSTAEGTTAPDVTVRLDSGAALAEQTPKTVAPPPRPGPVMSVDIPKLKLRTGVVPTEWEPPPFAVGQIKTTANVTVGNTVLIGHLTGAAGNVFAHLDQLQPGDEVTAVSRGVPYKFVVSRMFKGPAADSSPIDASDDARLTLMTCTGIWNPLTHEYSERLWVVAEPPDRAAETIANAAATATAQATATAAAEPTQTPEPTSTPMPVFEGEPSPAGGLGDTRPNLGEAFGAALGETQGKLVVFHQPNREYHVLFTPEPARAALVAEFPASGVRLTLDVAVREARRFLPSDAVALSAGPEGNAQMVVERFTSASIEQALGTPDVSVVYPRDKQQNPTAIIVGLGTDYEALIAQARR